MACVVAALIALQTAVAQTGDVPQEGLRTDLTDLPTPINQPPDANAQMKARERQNVRRNFDRANALRMRQIADESTKLLILTTDLKLQMDKTENKPLPPDLIREIEVIRILAHDVQTKMTLTVGPG